MEKPEELRITLEKKFDSLWTSLAIQNHIVKALTKKGNSKQAVEKAEHFNTVTRKEIMSDVLQWYALKPHFKERIDEDVIRDDLIHRINGELAVIGVPLLSFLQTR